MVFPLVLAGFVALLFALYRFLASGPPSRRSVPSVLTFSVALGAVRAMVTGLGFYGVEHTGGALQVPAFAMALAGWPEIALLGPHRGRASPAFYGWMALLLIVTSTAVVAFTALAARRRP